MFVVFRVFVKDCLMLIDSVLFVWESYGDTCVKFSCLVTLRRIRFETRVWFLLSRKIDFFPRLLFVICYCEDSVAVFLVVRLEYINIWISL